MLIGDAENGVVETQYNLAMKYANKEGGFHNEKEAAKWFELAAKQGFKAKKNVSKALEILKSDAENGIPEAQYTLSVMYGNGDGVPQDIKKSIMWCQLAAEGGHAVAQMNLGVMYSNGQGVPEDKQKALKWYQLALKQGYNEARDIIYYLAKTNHSQALKLLIDEAENDIIEAQIMLAVMYLTGQGVPEDKQKALKWYKTAAETKIHTKKIVKTSFRKKNIPQVLKRVVYNAEKGAVDAQINLALMYASGEIVPEDTNKALKWFQRSLKLKIESEKISIYKMANKNVSATLKVLKNDAERGSPEAQYYLGMIYDSKKPDESNNRLLAYFWYNLSAFHGHKDALKQVELMKHKMSEVEKGEAQTMVEKWNPKQ